MLQGNLCTLLKRTDIKSNRCLLILSYLAWEVLCNLVLGTCVSCTVLQYFPPALQTPSKPQTLFPLFSFFSLFFFFTCLQRHRVFKGAMDSREKLQQVDAKNMYVCMCVCLSQVKATFNHSDSAVKSRACLRAKNLFDLQRNQG